MSKKLEELREKKEQLKLGGGKDRIEKQHKRGKLSARERLDLLFDEGSFIEIGGFVKHRSTDFGMDKIETPAEGVVTGYGTVAGRLVYAYAQDFTVMGGSLGNMHAEKIVNVMEMAMKMGAPIIGMNDSGGARIQEGVDALSGYAKIFFNNTIASGVIPQISVIMGPCAGGAVYSPAITDFVFMVDKTSQMFITGPQVIKTVTGEDVSSEELGGAMTHNATSGVAHFMSENDEACIEDIKRLLSFLPSNNMESAPYYETNDDLNRIEESLNEIVPDNPNKPYDIKEIITTIADNRDFMETQQYYATNIVTGFIRINGQSVGVIANQPRVLAGCLDINASDKAGRFIRTCDAFNIPLLNIVDVPGFLPGTDQEYGGIIRHGAKMLYAYSEATVPKAVSYTHLAIKAGIMEIGDIFVVNKADLEGAHRTMMELETMLDFRQDEGWKPPVLEAIGRDNIGIGQICDNIEKHMDFLVKSDKLGYARRENVKKEIIEIAKGSMEVHIFNNKNKDNQLEILAERVANKEQDPYTASDEILKSFINRGIKND